MVGENQCVREDGDPVVSVHCCSEIGLEWGV